MRRSDFANEFRRLTTGFGLAELQAERIGALWDEWRNLPLTTLTRAVDLGLQGDRYPSAVALRKCIETAIAETDLKAARAGARSLPGGFRSDGSWTRDSLGTDPLTDFARYALDRRREDFLSPSELAALAWAHAEFLGAFHEETLAQWASLEGFHRWPEAKALNSLEMAIKQGGQSIATWAWADGGARWREVCALAAARGYDPDLSRGRWDARLESKSNASAMQVHGPGTEAPASQERLPW